MKAIYVFCEGQTEQEFCNRLLFRHLEAFGYSEPHAIRVAHSRHRGVVSRGGLTRYAPLSDDIRSQLKGRVQRHVVFTTMIDLYALPKDFPGRSGLTRDPGNPTPFVEALEQAFAKDIDDPRFVPYIQLHEFETLLFSDPEAFRISFEGCDKAVENLQKIVESHASVEHIDDGPTTAPSKRILEEIRSYSKVLNGPDIAEFIGLDTLRRSCPHFHGWIVRLEQSLPFGLPSTGEG